MPRRRSPVTPPSPVAPAPVSPPIDAELPAVPGFITPEPTATGHIRVEPPRANRGGRPPELTEDAQASILRYINAGNFLETAAPASQVPIRTARRWLSKGAIEARNAEREGREINPEQEIYVRFWQALKEAEARSQARHVTNISVGAFGRPGSTVTTERVLADGTIERTTTVTEGTAPIWTASAWYLERTNPKRYGRRNYSEVAAPGGKPLFPLSVVRDILAEADEDDTTTPDA